MNRHSSTVAFGDLVRSRREAIDLAPEGLAWKSEINLRTLNRIEANETSPHRNTRKAILAALEEAEAEYAEQLEAKAA